MTGASDGTNRLFVVEQGGRIKAYTQAGASLGPFLDISGSIATGGERGLLGLAFHPDYETNAQVLRQLHPRAAATPPSTSTGPRSRTPTSPTCAARRRILTIEPAVQQPQRRQARLRSGRLPVHRDGRWRRQRRRAQQRAEHEPLLGKILRIDINGTTGARQYRIPTLEPFVGRAGRNEIWSCGLRNPWKFSFDRTRGDLWIGDVGQNRWEEINRKQVTSTGAPAARGSNFGWRVMEGWHCFRPASGCSRSGKVRPVAEYQHTAGNCSVTGGYVYRGSSAPLVGKYIFADFCSGRIWSIPRGAKTPATKTLLRNSAQNISSFGEGDDGEVYMVSLSSGKVYRVLA